MELNNSQIALARAFDRPYSDIARDEKLLYLRRNLEIDHRGQVFFSSAWRTYEPPIDQPLPPINQFEFPDFCNKSVPIYFLNGQWRFAGTLCNYIYRQWFKPFRSEIEHGRFLTKYIAPKNAENRSHPITASIGSFIALHKAICTNIHQQRKEYAAVIASGADNHHIVKDHQNYVLQPLFEALVLVIDPGNWKGEDSTLIGRLPVTMARTGVETGLSSPITFESIVDKIDEYIGETAVKTTLETAITFVTELEARETRVFGLQPNPIASWDPDYSFPQWRDIMPYDQMIGPSTRFVDIEKCLQSLQQLQQNNRNWDQQYVDVEEREARQYIEWIC
ncbi:uncharacterized protein TrAtP1_005498 [Trichoderma atroviride]|uniref:Uncharacterized protein n=1 Tax=Hypocrea atroviridis (strain ATCC 20476 / IMI 206040) TaxID=452589 RepID=G9NRA7_HYPAI|nr:uncharacterized protein TRIATDRAFT_43552 [Trichoderma atroviride IMI 206040]EHK46542.1 hypothetical protein TRIATDRAFT_43552 [Trichoderma atroviride IMI 206040]UKZ64280.1 hypothetical protein TrAtP1_005498 [Trichoderma atroviride]